MANVLLNLYDRIHRIDLWTRRHFTESGHLFLAFLLASAIFGIDTHTTTTYQLFSLLLIIVIFSLLGSCINRLVVTIERDLPRYATVGKPLNYSIQVTNQRKKSYHSLALIDQLSAPQPTSDQLQMFYRSASKHWYQSMISFRQWQWFATRLRGGSIKEQLLPALKQEPQQIINRFIPLRRGKVTFSGCYIAKPDLLGLFRRLIFIPIRHSIMVLPKRYPIEPLALPGRRQYQPGGITLANSVGDSAEFIGLRKYHKGDPLHSIHWKSFAKHGRLIVKEYQDEFFVRRALLLDTLLGEGLDEQFETAVSVIASIANSEQHQEDLLDMMFIGDAAYCFTAGRGLDHRSHLQEILATAQPCHSGSFEQLHDAVMNHAAQCSSFVCVLLQWDQQRRRLIQALTIAGLPVAVFLVHDGSIREEVLVDPPKPLYLIDYHTIEVDLAAVGR